MISAFAFVGSVLVQPAHSTPPCSGGVGGDITPSISIAHIGDSITYTVSIFISPNDCELNGLTATFTFPGGIICNAGSNCVLNIDPTSNPGSGGSCTIGSTFDLKPGGVCVYDVDSITPPSALLSYVIVSGGVKTVPAVMECVSFGVTPCTVAEATWTIQSTTVGGTTEGPDTLYGDTVVLEPAITLVKTPSANSVLPGTLVTYTYDVCNTGNAPLTVGISDNLLGTVATGVSLAPGDCTGITYTKSTTLTVTTTNIGTATGVDLLGGPLGTVTATSTATVTVPTISTTVYDAATGLVWGGSEVTGASAYDTSVVGGAASGLTPTGSVTYTFYTASGSCTGDYTTQVVQLNPDGSVPNSAATGALAAGSYSYTATYSGDSNYVSVTSSCESISVSPTSVTLGTTLGFTSPLALGSTASDTASFGTFVTSIPPTGTVTYYLVTGACPTSVAPGSGGTSIGSVTVGSGGSIPGSAPTSALGAGTYEFYASYAGDGNYNSVTSRCELFYVSTANPGIGTTLGFTSPLTLGSTASDTASFGNIVGSIYPTGTVTYYLFSTGTSPSSCDVTGTVVATVTVGASGSIPASGSTAALAAGNYAFDAVYTPASGETNYVTSTSSCEPFSVTGATVTLGTTLGFTSPLALGSTPYDTASFGTFVTSIPPTGTVTYYLVTGACASAEGPGSGGTSIGSVTVGSAGSIPNSAPTSALGPGTYLFYASYAGDSNYGPVTSACEFFRVSQGSLSLTTTVYSSGTEVTEPLPLGSTAYDEATVVSGVVEGFTPSGTVTITLYPGDSCSGTPISTQSGVALGSPSSTTSALAAGSYSFEASAYTGDTNYAISGYGGCEPFSVLQATPVVGTLLGAASPLSLGSTEYDTATVTGVSGFTPTGTVTYNFYAASGSCTGDYTTQTVSVNPDGSVPNSEATSALVAGAYSYTATYSGDGNYVSVTSSCEPFSVSGSAVTLTTLLGFTSPLTLGSTASDTASFSSVVDSIYPTGTVTYYLITGTCPIEGPLTGGTSIGSVTVGSGGSIPNSAPTSALGAGSYGFYATYSGDSNYASATSGCEPFSVGQATPSISTTVYDAATKAVWTGSEVTGASAYDTAAVTGNDLGGFADTGTISYTYYSTSACVPGTGAPAGTGSSSTTEGPLGAGTYYFQATISGDSNYNSMTSGCESFTVGTATPSTSTAVYDASTSAPWAGTEVTGSSAYDTATVTGVSGFTPTGSVTYTFYTASGSCTGASTTQEVTISSGTVPNSNPTPALAAGSYSYTATYSGDSNYASAPSSCEPFTVLSITVTTTILTPSSGVETIATGTTQDSATLIGATAGTSGTVTYYLYSSTTAESSSAGCGGTIVDTSSPVSVTSGTVGNSPTYGPLGAGYYGWSATYTPPSGSSSSSNCEPLAIQATPTLTTEIEFQSSPVGYFDSATLTGATSNAGGSVTYTLYSLASSIPSTNTAPCSQVSGTPIAGDSFTVTVASGIVPDSSVVTGLSTGYYGWEAVYSGDPINQGAPSNPGATSACEGFSVSTPVITPGVSLSITCSISPNSNKPCTGEKAPGKITWTITLDNPETYTETVGLLLSGPSGATTNCLSSYTLTAGQTVVCTVTANNLSPGSYTETANATPAAEGVTGSTVTASSTCTISPTTPKVSLSITCGTNQGQPCSKDKNGNQKVNKITWTITVSNPENFADTVYLTLSEPSGATTNCLSSYALSAGQTVTCTVTLSNPSPGTYTVTASAYAVYDGVTGPTVTVSCTSTVSRCGGGCGK